jgi:hypothetical protein
MTALEQEILDSLLELEQAVKTVKTAKPPPDLPALFARLDALGGQLPPSTDPNLLHYLQKKSYEKARMCLQGREGENVRGECPR